MKTIEYRTIDKSNWGDGAWQTEPDKVQWKDKTTGLPCLAVRQPNHGAWCGYVGLAEGHKFYGKDYDAPDVEVHGGLTFADKCQPDADETKHICHVPGVGEPDHVWWFGFDCAHAGDANPAYDHRYGFKPVAAPWNKSGYDEYRDLPYVKRQVRKLAKQLAAL